MTTVNSADKDQNATPMDYVLHGRKIQPEEMSADQWWSTINVLLMHVHPYIDRLQGFVEINMRLEAEADIFALIGEKLREARIDGFTRVWEVASFFNPQVDDEITISNLWMTRKLQFLIHKYQAVEAGSACVHTLAISLINEAGLKEIFSYSPEVGAMVIHLINEHIVQTVANTEKNLSGFRSLAGVAEGINSRIV